MVLKSLYRYLSFFNRYKNVFLYKNVPQKGRYRQKYRKVLKNKEKISGSV